MSELNFLGLLAVTAAWFLLPLLPALKELFRPTDTDPLRVVGRDTGDVAFFARKFRQYLEAQLYQLPATAGPDFLGRLADGTHFGRVTHGVAILERGALTCGAHDRVFVLEAATALQGGETFLQEFCTRAPFTGGPDAVYRAVLGESAVTLGDRSMVLRWIHSAGPLAVGRGSALGGRVSSDSSVLLGRETTFERIGAPVIRTEGPGRQFGVAEPESPGDPGPALPPEARKIGDHTRVDGDLPVPAGAAMGGHLVVTGSLRLGPGAKVEGSVKAHGAITLERGSRVQGSLVCRTRLDLGARCSAGGPVIAEESIRIGAGATVGGPDAPTTVSAPTVTLGPAACIHGQILAPNGGRVL